MNKNHPTVGEALVNLLADYGVELVFGIPGTHSIELYRGLQSGRIRHISPRHEQGGGFMADGYARVSGKPGVCFVITGPGVTNITTPMGEAYMDSVPMLVISPVNPLDVNRINRGRLHEITDQAAVTAPLTAFSQTIESADDLPEAIARAFAVFSSQRPRPVHLHIPLPLLHEHVTEFWQPAELPGLPVASQTEIDYALSWIEQADNPVIVAGGGMIEGAEALDSLARKLHCPVLTTVAGRGVISQSHPLGLGAQLRAPATQAVLQAADLGIFLGTEFAQTDHWNDDIQLPGRQIWINICPDTLDRDAYRVFTPPSNSDTAKKEELITIQADCRDAAERLAKGAKQPDPERMARVDTLCARTREAHQNVRTGKEAHHWLALQGIMRAVDTHVTIVSDMTQLAYTAVDYLPMSRPKQWLHPTGYGTLGYALPAAIGAALARPDDPCLAIIGDAGFQYTFAEMTLAAELELNLVVLLWNNHALQQICDDMDNANIERIGIFQRNPDFIGLAEACHWGVERVELVDRREVGQALHDALMKAFERPGPVLVMLEDRETSPDD